MHGGLGSIQLLNFATCQYVEVAMQDPDLIITRQSGVRRALATNMEVQHSWASMALGTTHPCLAETADCQRLQIVRSGGVSVIVHIYNCLKAKCVILPNRVSRKHGAQQGARQLHGGPRHARHAGLEGTLSAPPTCQRSLGSATRATAAQHSTSLLAADEPVRLLCSVHNPREVEEPYGLALGDVSGGLPNQEAPQHGGRGTTGAGGLE